MAKVEAPNKGYNGPGPGGVVFVDGVAETGDEAALNYFRDAGYTVDGNTTNPVDDPEPPDPRDLSNIVVGTPLRDAAVDPAKSDFLAPTNAGKANPHGSEVVSPEIHASGPAGITSGVVFVEDADKQEKRETDRARARLVKGQTGGQVVDTEVPDMDDRGELDLSDPGSADAGRVNDAGADTDPGADNSPADVDAELNADAGSDEVTDKPAKAAPKSDWVDWAVTQGADRDEAEASTKADLVEKYGTDAS